MDTIAPVPTAEILLPESQEKLESAWCRYFHQGENAIVTLALAALVVLPLLESVLRKTLHLGLSGSTALVQHFTLILGVVGGVIAARENRLMPLSTLVTLLKGKKKRRRSSSRALARPRLLLCCAGRVGSLCFRKDLGGKSWPMAFPSGPCNWLCPWALP